MRKYYHSGREYKLLLILILEPTRELQSRPEWNSLAPGIQEGQQEEKEIDFRLEAEGEIPCKSSRVRST